MAFNRQPIKDPRTIARDIPGIFHTIFPQLTAGVVSYLNKKAVTVSSLVPISDEKIQSCSLQPAMLFEIAYVRSEQLLKGNEEADWDECKQLALFRQRRYFDAILPLEILDADLDIAELIAKNLFKMLSSLPIEELGEELIFAPRIQGYQWIANGEGDFAFRQTLIEVKCTRRRFGSADYRQILMYWLLSFAASIESGAQEWQDLVLMNPRRNMMVSMSFDEIIAITAAGKTKIEVLELFSSLVGDMAWKTLPEFKL